MADGKRIVYRGAVTGPDQLIWRPSDGSESPTSLMTSESNLVPAAWSPDGRALAFYSLGETPGLAPPAAWLLPLDGGREARPLLDTRFSAAGVDFSPDGRWIAYASNESGRPEVYVRSYPRGDTRRQISSGGGMSPVWNRNGRELFYLQRNVTVPGPPEVAMMAVPIATLPVLNVGVEKRLFKGDFVVSTPARGYDVAPDGQRFVMLRQKETPPVTVKHLVLVQNWFEELNRRVPTR
jgi:hypothetical protein